MGVIGQTMTSPVPGALLLSFKTSLRETPEPGQGRKTATFCSTISGRWFYNLGTIPKKALVRRCKDQGTSAKETVTLITMSRESAISLQPPKLPPRGGNQRSVFNLKDWRGRKAPILPTLTPTLDLLGALLVPPSTPHERVLQKKKKSVHSFPSPVVIV